MLISRAINIENENVNLDKGALETVSNPEGLPTSNLGVTSKRKERHDHQQTTLTRQTISLFLDTDQTHLSTLKPTQGFKKISHRTFKK